ncbi:hypothetical protein [Streptomyces sp. NPDC056049]|uniref:hypothetical protein n=1 Tax=Streptomyces sp. NPDC056049 TaxID=3345693 RepID=UPI0035D5C7C6
MLPDLTAARTALETAQREAEEARALVETLAERVRDGAEDITGADIAAQRQLAELAGLRVTGAERKLAEAVKVDRDARCKRTVEAARALLAADSTAPILDAITAIRESVARLMAAVDSRNESIKAVGTQIAALDSELVASGAGDSLPLYRLYGGRGNAKHITVRDPDRGVLSADFLHVADLASSAVVSVLTAHPESRQMGERFPMDARAVRKVSEAVPGLADAWRCTDAEWQAMDSTGRHRAAIHGRQPLPEGAEG